MSADPDDRNELALSGVDRDGHALWPGLTLEEVAQLAMAGAASTPHASGLEAPTRRRRNARRTRGRGSIPPPRPGRLGGDLRRRRRPRRPRKRWSRCSATAAGRRPASEGALSRPPRLGRLPPWREQAPVPRPSRRRQPGPADPGMPLPVSWSGGPEATPSRPAPCSTAVAVGRIGSTRVRGSRATPRRWSPRRKGRCIRAPGRTVFQPAGRTATPPPVVDPRLLVEPLARDLDPPRRGWEVDRACREEATLTASAVCSGGAETPALLFTGCHGLGCRPDAMRPPTTEQGGPGLPGVETQPATENGGSHLLHRRQRRRRRLPRRGWITFSLSCFGAGTPSTSTPSRRAPSERQSSPIAAFVAALPPAAVPTPAAAPWRWSASRPRLDYSFTAQPGVGRQIEVYASPSAGSSPAPPRLGDGALQPALRRADFRVELAPGRAALTALPRATTSATWSAYGRRATTTGRSWCSATRPFAWSLTAERAGAEA